MVHQTVCPGGQHLPAVLRQKEKPWLADLRAQAESYVAEGGDAAALEQRFGTPQQMAFTYVDEMPTADLLAELHIRRRLVAVTAITLAAALAILAAALVWQQYTLHKDLSGWNRTMVTNVRHWTVDD